MASSRAADPIITLWSQVLRLSTAQQFDLFVRLGEYLNDRPAKATPIYTEAQARVRALGDLRLVCAGLERDPALGITVREYDEVASRDGLMLSGAVVRAFNGWENAKAALRGDAIPLTPRQSAKRRWSRRGQGASRPERLAVVREFLASKPPEVTKPAFDDWARAENAKRASSAPQLVLSSAIQRGCSLRWPAILAAAGGEQPLTLTDADYPIFIPISMASILTGDSQAIGVRRGFPLPVADSGYCRLWLRDDVLAYRDGTPVPERALFSMQADLVFTADLAALLGRPAAWVRKLVRTEAWEQGRIPKPCTVITGVAIVWWRSEVDRFVEASAQSAAPAVGPLPDKRPDQGAKQAKYSG